MHWGVKGLRFGLAFQALAHAVPWAPVLSPCHVKLNTLLNFLPLSNFYLASIVDPLFTPCAFSFITYLPLFLQDQCDGWRSLDNEVTLRMETLKRVGKEVWRSMDFCWLWSPHIRPGWFLSRREINNLSCFSLVIFCVTPRQI